MDVLEQLELLFDSVVEAPRVAHLYCRICEDEAWFSAVCGWADVDSVRVDNPNRKCVSCSEIAEVVRKCPRGHFLWLEDLP